MDIWWCFLLINSVMLLDSIWNVFQQIWKCLTLMVIGQAEGKYLKSCFLLLLRFVVMLFCCENQFSFTKKSVCTWLTEQPLSQWMMAIIIKREDFSKQEWFACKRSKSKEEREREAGKKTDFLPCSSLFIQRPNIP